MKHTPGDWKVTPNASHIYVNDGKGNDGVICKMADSHSPVQWACEGASLENTANAKLIASAPAMYAALKGLVNAMDANGSPWADEPETDAARAALQQVEAKDV